METTNQTKNNPFTAFGTPAKVVINGATTPTAEIPQAIEALTRHFSVLKSFAITRINGIVKVYAAY